MLTISSPQFGHLSGGIRSRAAQRMIAHVERHFPHRAKVAGRPAVEKLVERCFADAETLQLAAERDLFYLLSLQLYFGAGFRHDRQYAIFAAILQRPDVATPSARIKRAWREGMAFHRHAAGEQGRHLEAAIQRLAGRRLARLLADESPLNSVQAQGLLAEIWPEKHAVLQLQDPQAFAGLMTQVGALAKQHGISNRGAARLLLLLSFVFGIDFGRDPMLEPMAGMLRQGGQMNAGSVAAGDALLGQITGTGGA